MKVIEQAARIHVLNANWWRDLQTGECMLATRNRGDLLMLVVTEVSEAAFGVDGKADDKLPHLPMFDCELADSAIRLLDIVGAEVKLGRFNPDGCQFVVPQYILATLRHLNTAAQLLEVVNAVSRAKEAERKQRWQGMQASVIAALQTVFAIAQLHGVDLADVIEQKLAFNQTRADHQPENRRQAGGKLS